MRRRTLLSSGIATTLILGSSATLPLAARADGRGSDPLTGPVAPSIENLGVPISTVRVTSATFGYWRDGRPVVYTAGGQPENPMRFTVLDASTGEQLDAHTVPDTHRGNHLLLAPDGNVYIASWGPHAYLLRYSPESGTITNLGFGIPDDVVITKLVAGDNGFIYGGGYPSGHVFSYNTETESFADLGQAVDEEPFAYSLAYAPGQLFVGTEPHARLVSIDLATGERTSIDTPEWTAGETRHFHLAYRGGLLFSYTSPSLDWHVYDTETGEWIDRIERNGQGGLTEVDENGNVYFGKLTDGLYRYNLEDRSGGPVGWPLTSAEASSGTSLLDLKDPEWPGQTVVGMGSRGDMWLWNPQTQRGEKRPMDVPSFPMTIRSLGLGPDENVYIGGGTSEVTVAAYDTTNEEFLNFTRGPAARVDAIASMNDKVFFTTYGQGILFEYDPAKPYNYGNNPRQVFQLYADYHQERIYALSRLDEFTLALGTIGGRGVDTGQLFLYNDESKEKIDLGEPLQGHAIASLTNIDGYLIGGTTVDVLGGESPVDEARIFVWDLEAGELIWDGVPEPGAKDVSELVVDDNGQVWGLTTSGKVFTFDLATREFGDLVSVGRAGGLWGHGTLEFGPDKRLYGATAPGEVFVLDPNTLAAETLADGEYAMFDSSGRLYYAQGGSLYRMTLADEHPASPLEGLRTSFNTHVAEGAIREPSAHQLNSALSQAERHAAAGRVVPAGTALNRFIRHLDPKQPDQIDATAASELSEQAATARAAIG